MNDHLINNTHPSSSEPSNEADVLRALGVNVDSIDAKSYQVFIGDDALHRLPELLRELRPSAVCFVIDSAVATQVKALLGPLFSAGNQPSDLKAHIEEVTTSEGIKTLVGVYKLCQKFLAIGLDRKSLIVNIGGGLLCDLGGFAASIYMRGIPFINVPTTLLAQADASIGGKVGVNAGGVKNLLGSFQQPLAVLADTRFLDTLPLPEFRSGFAEMIKHGLVASAEHFAQLESCEPFTALPQSAFKRAAIADLLAVTCKIKADIIRADERETIEPNAPTNSPETRPAKDISRKLLNFGHTVGHAIESISHELDTPILHGEAVAIGIVAEATISKLIGHLDGADLRRIRDILLRFGLPLKAPFSTNVAAIEKKIASDKKNVSSQINWVLLDSIGKGLVDVEVPNKIVTEALESILT